MPNAQVLEAKKAQVAEAVELLKNTQTGVLVDYRGLNVAEDTDLRNKLREANVKYFVIKNKILKRAVEEIGLEGLDEVLHGPTALAVSAEDAVAPAKILADYAKENEKLEIKGGFMDGSVMSLDEIKKLWSCDVMFKPDTEEEKRRKLVMGWHKAVGRSLNWEEKEQ